MMKNIPLIVLGLILVSCNEKPSKPSSAKGSDTVVVGKTFCKDGALYETPPWEDKNNIGFLVVKNGKHVSC